MNKNTEEFKYTPQNNNGAVIGILEGPCADITDATRNGRFYSEELWEKVFDSEIVKEMLDNGGIFGESQHPADRTEIDTEKIAIAMKERPIKKDGSLFGKFYILNTPCGRILKTLADFGYKIGISSRGSGDTYLDERGKEAVDPDTYQFTCFDAVLIPAMKSARMKYTSLTESLQKNPSLQNAIQESLDEATEHDRQIMIETLNDLSIKYNTKENTTTNGVLYRATPERDFAAENDGANGTIKDLQEALKEKKTMSAQIKSLQEKLSVCYTKEANTETLLAESNSQIRTLNETLSTKDSTIKSLNEQVSLRNKIISQFEKQKQRDIAKSTTLEEELKSNRNQISELKKEITTLNEQLTVSENSRINEIRQLKEQLSESNKDSAIKKSEYTTKVNRQQELVEKYKSMARTAVDKYVKSQSVLLGVSPTEIKNRLGESYSFNDIDRVCESLRNYKLNASSLPFESGAKKPVRVRISEALPAKPVQPTNSMVDDEPDEQLLGLANYMGV